MRFLALALLTTLITQSTYAQLSVGGTGGIKIGGGMRYGAFGGASTSAPSRNDDGSTSSSRGGNETSSSGIHVEHVIPRGYFKWLTEKTGIPALEFVDYRPDHSFMSALTLPLHIHSSRWYVDFKNPYGVKGTCSLWVTMGSDEVGETEECVFTRGKVKRVWTP